MKAEIVTAKIEELDEYPDLAYLTKVEPTLLDLSRQSAENIYSIRDYELGIYEYSDLSYLTKVEPTLLDLCWKAAENINSIRDYKLDIYKYSVFKHVKCNNQRYDNLSKILEQYNIYVAGVAQKESISKRVTMKAKILLPPRKLLDELKNIQYGKKKLVDSQQGKGLRAALLVMHFLYRNRFIHNGKKLFPNKGKSQKDYYTPLHRDIMTSVCGSNDVWGNIKSALVKAGILEVHIRTDKLGKLIEPYSKGQCCKLYRLTEKWRNAKFVNSPVDFEYYWKQFEGKTIPPEPEAKAIKSDGIPKFFRHPERITRTEENIRHLSLDYEEAMTALTSARERKAEKVKQWHIDNPKPDKRKKQPRCWTDAQFSVFENMVLNIDQPNVSDSVTGRLYTDFNRIPKAVRKLVKFKGQKLVYPDINCCQPHLLALLYKADSEEKRRYLKLIESGFFYDSVISYVKFSKEGLSEGEKKGIIKKETFVYYFSNKEQGLKIAKFYEDNFPELFLEVRKFKNIHGADKLAHYLQGIESSVIIDIIQVMYDCVAVHDSVACLEIDHERIVAEIKYQFLQLYDLNVNVGDD